MIHVWCKYFFQDLWYERVISSPWKWNAMSETKKTSLPAQNLSLSLCLPPPCLQQRSRRSFPAFMPPAIHRPSLEEENQQDALLRSFSSSYKDLVWTGRVRWCLSWPTTQDTTSAFGKLKEGLLGIGQMWQVTWALTSTQRKDWGSDLPILGSASPLFPFSSKVRSNQDSVQVRA